MKRCVVYIVFVLLFAGLASLEPSAEWFSSVRNLSISPDSLYKVLTTSHPSFPAISPGIHTYSHDLADTLTAPYYLYIPKSYKPGTPQPMVVALHGGVSRPSFRADFHESLSPENNPLIDIAEKEGWVVLYPLGKLGCEWWTKTGMDNILWQIRWVKERVNIDDDKVFLTGISDGGSGSYFMALLDPGVFAGFLPVIGQMNVGTYVTGEPIYPRNLKNRPLVAWNTENDPLYPDSQARKLVTKSLRAGANIDYRMVPGLGHDASFLKDETGTLVSFIRRNSRNPFANRVTWEAGNPEFGQCDWLTITGIDTLAKAAPWHTIIQDTLADRRVSLGFFNDDAYQGKGVLVKQIAGPDTPSAQCGLLAGDIITALDGKPCTDIKEFLTLRDTKKRGQRFTLTVTRDERVIKLKGKLPPAQRYAAFDYADVPGMVMGRFYANTFEVRTSRVNELSLKISPEMVDLDQPVRILINGKTVFNERVSIDRDFMVSQFDRTFDRKAVWVREITVKVP